MKSNFHIPCQFSSLKKAFKFLKKSPLRPPFSKGGMGGFEKVVSKK
jgi:hypothetical protein